MRLFQPTAFYVELILQTLVKILPFMLLLMIGLTMFGIPMILLNMNRVSSDVENVIEEHTHLMLPNLFINQYLLALGEFSLDGIEEK